MTGWPAADTTENDVEGTTRHGGETRSSVSDAHTVKSRLFGDGSNDLLKQMIKARLLADLSQPTELGEDDEDPSATNETLTHGQGNTTKGPGGELPLAPLRIGRFTVLRKLGHGGMGVVYAAYDERLDRKIAIKVLRSELGDSERGRTRMLREAQALARLSHPNVVQVHEVGRWRDHDYVAMEFIDGKTLDRWVGATSRTWKEVLEVVMQAGRGLAEAHRVGLIHRDFKPANVLVGQDGRARVLDFGLARSAADPADSHSQGDLDQTYEQVCGHVDGQTEGATGHTGTGSNAFATALTMTGAVLGTPAYMAPEQHLGETVSAASDQFAFCVVLYEALFGHRPYRAETRSEYAVRVTEGQFVVPGASSGVPAWLRKIVLKGLAPEPRDRWPSMDALLAELGRDRARTWRRATVAAGLLAVIGGALSLQERPQLCNYDDHSTLAGLWDVDMRRQVGESFVATGLEMADDARVRVEAGLDTYADGLVAARTRACSDRWIDQRQTDDQFALRSSCLEQREQELRAAVEILAEADAEVVLNATSLLEGLGEIELCDRVELLEVGMPAPRDQESVAAIAALRQDLARGRAAVDVGRMDVADRIIADAKTRARELDYMPLTGELYFLEGRRAMRQFDFAGARGLLQQATTAAERSGADLLAAESWTKLALVVAGREDEATWSLVAGMADAAVSRAGELPRLRAEYLGARGRHLLARGEIGEAREALDLAVDYSQRTGALLQEAAWLATRASVRELEGDIDGARADFDRVISFESVLGAQNPKILDAVFDRGALELEQGNVDAAKRDFLRARAGYEQAFGPDYPGLAHVRMALAGVAMEHGDLAGARDEIQKTLLGMVQDPEERHWVLDALAGVELEANRPSEAMAASSAALDEFNKLEVQDPSRRAYLLARLGKAQWMNGDGEAALVSYDEALQHYEHAELAAPEELIETLLGQARVYSSRGRHEEALVALERSIGLLSPELESSELALQVQLETAAVLDVLGNAPGRRDEMVAAVIQAGQAAKHRSTAERELYERALDMQQESSKGPQGQ